MKGVSQQGKERLGAAVNIWELPPDQQLKATHVRSVQSDREMTMILSL